MSVRWSIIVPVFGYRDRLAKLLDSLNSARIPEGGAELILVDNHREAEDYSELIVNMVIPVRVAHEPKPGSYAARNTGARLAKGTFLAFTDADCAVDPHWLTNCVANFANGANIVAGRIQSTFPSRPLNLAETYGWLMQFDQQSVSARGEALTANVLVRRRVFEKTGGFNEALFSGGDLEWSRRASCEFGLFYADDSVVYHPVRHRLREIFGKRKRIVGGLVELNRIRGTRLRWIPWFLPPRLCFTVWKEKTLPLTRRGQLAALRYALQLYGAWHRILLTFGATRPSRM